MAQDVAFLFDNDGVLIDSSELHWKSWVLFMKEEPRLHMKYDDFIHTFGRRNDLILKELAPQVSEDERKAWAMRKEEIFRGIAKNKITLLPGIEKFLQSVKQQNYPRIIASSTAVKNLELFISSTILGNFFDKFVSAEQVAHGKPFPDVFLAAAKELKFPPEKCIVLEDAPSGIEAGKRAGCFVVALGTTHRKEKLQDYDLFFESPLDLDLERILSHFSKSMI